MIPEKVFLVSFWKWKFQLSLPSVVTPNGFVVTTCSTWVPSIVTDEEVVTVFSLWPDPISINSVLVSLFAFSQVCTFDMSYLRHDSTLSTSLFAYVRCVSSADIVGSPFKNLFGRSFMYNKPRIVPEGHRRLVHGSQIRTHHRALLCTVLQIRLKTF